MDVLKQIQQERQRQDEKWGEQNHDPFKWIAILVEEVGEVAEAALKDDPFLYRKELIQVAAVAVAAIECLDRHHAQPPSWPELKPPAGGERKRGEVPGPPDIPRCCHRRDCRHDMRDHQQLVGGVGKCNVAGCNCQRFYWSEVS